MEGPLRLSELLADPHWCAGPIRQPLSTGYPPTIRVSRRPGSMQGLCECFYEGRRCTADTPQSPGGCGRCAVQPDALAHALWVNGGDFELMAEHGTAYGGYDCAREGCAPL